MQRDREGKQKRRRGRSRALRWALPGAALALVWLAAAGDVARFVESVRLYSDDAIPSLALEWKLAHEVEPALARRDPDAALAALAAADETVRLFEIRVAPYRIRAWLAKDNVPRALAYYDGYLLAGGAAEELPAHVHETLAPYLARSRARGRTTPIDFVDTTSEWNAGFHHVHRSGRRLAGLHEAMGSGVALADLDGDALLDIIYLGGGDAGNRVLRGRPGGRFEDVTAGSGIGSTGMAFGLALADLTGDQLPEVYITARGANRLFRNLGGMRFDDITEAAGVAGAGGFSTGATFGDIDGDDDLDLYVARWVRVPETEDRIIRAVFGDRGRLALFTPHMYRPESNHLFRNDGDLRFTEVTRADTTADATGRGLGVVLFDLNADARSDLFVANDESPNRLLLADGHGGFLDSSASARMYDARAGMGVAVTDADADGAPDLVYTNFRTEFNVLALNRLTEGYFSEQTERFGLAAGSLGVTSWGVVVEDLDNDGDADLATVNGHPTPFDPHVSAFRGALVEHDGCLPEAPLVYERRGEHFVDVSPLTGDLGRLQAVGRGLVAGDVDRDGGIDLVVTANNGAAHVYRNVSRRDSGSAHWLVVAPRWNESNRLAVGSTVIVETPDGTERSRVVLSGGSYLSQNPFEVHIGLGTHARAKRITVVWPDGSRTTRTDVAADRRVTIHADGP